MGKLKVLPANIANMIAAGEVVQRPASVVKELMENAVDAGADQVDVVVKDAGRTSIQVIDNGVGMSPADAVLCFERHATSKIAEAEDLQRITSYGFRGEALASIAAVAEVTLKTRRAADETATQVSISEPGAVKTSSVAAPTGSNFLIRNIFYNTPARRKFLKSDNVELKHIVEEFTRIALTRPDVGFSLNSNGRDIFRLRKAKSLKFRVLDLMGANVTGDLVDINAETSLVRVSGFLASPDTAHKTVANQFFFVNGRYFRSAYLHKAVMKAYEEYLPEGYTPSYFIWLEVAPESVDVNIHPTKAEVKFEEDSVIFQTIYACVRATLGRNAFGEGIDFNTEGRVEMPQMGSSFEEYRGPVSTAPGPALDEGYDPFTPNFEFDKPAVERHQDYGKLFEDNQAVQARALVVKGRFIIAPSTSGILLVHIRRAWERILYEKTLKALSKNTPVTQTALFPVQVEVGAASRLLFDEHAQMLASVGFDITPFGTDTVVVNGVPQGYSCEPGKVQQMVQDILLILSDETSGVPEVVRAALASKFATLGSVNAEPPRNAAEAQSLIDTLFACENAELTASGKKITAVLSAEDIEKRFQ
ncbi:MAG: DNA mismatch repair endonuclease MutL [Bacteroidales bacterium]|nr:DNA mismatch repair endonuclease MutL [Bacteroidales bacterium]